MIPGNKSTVMEPMRTSALVLTFSAAVALSASAQQPAPQQQTTPPLEIGALAPDFALPGATRFGLLREPVRLSDFRGKTVVLAFFFRARTRG
jgi:cytochrome oxidase Cu insertion factor (SCO1/SenC/PrrC family)